MKIRVIFKNRKETELIIQMLASLSYRWSGFPSFSMNFNQFPTKDILNYYGDGGYAFEINTASKRIQYNVSKFGAIRDLNKIIEPLNLSTQYIPKLFKEANT